MNTKNKPTAPLLGADLGQNQVRVGSEDRNIQKLPSLTDQGFNIPSASPNFGSYHSPYVVNYNNGSDGLKYTIQSVNGGSFNNYFGQSPPGGMTPLQNLLSSQHKIESPQLMQGSSPSFGKADYQDLMVDANANIDDLLSEGISKWLSSLGEASSPNSETDIPEESLRDPQTPAILNKNAESILQKNMTMENVQPAQKFDDIHVKKVEEKPVIEKPQIAEEIAKEVSNKTPLIKCFGSYHHSYKLGSALCISDNFSKI